MAGSARPEGRERSVLAALVMPEIHPDDFTDVGPYSYAEILVRELPGQGRTFRVRLRALDGPHPNEVLKESPWARMPWQLFAHWKGIVGERSRWGWLQVRDAVEKLEVADA